MRAKSEDRRLTCSACGTAGHVTLVRGACADCRAAVDGADGADARPSAPSRDRSMTSFSCGPMSLNQLGL